MDLSKSGVLVTLLFSLASGLACSRSANTNTPRSTTTANSANANAARTNVEELGLLVRVPFEPEDIVWKEYPASKRVVAVLRFSPANSNRVVAEAEKLGAPEAVAIAVETWFSDELIAQGEMSGDSTLRGKAYPANAFFQEPYTSGRITRIDETDYFILDVTAK